jgi:hypothetical protein
MERRENRIVWIAVVLALAACGGGSSTPSVASDTPVLYVPGTTTVVSNPVAFTSGQSVQFEPQEAGYEGTFTIQAAGGTSGAACISTFPATVPTGQSFTSATASSSGCSTYPQTATYNVSDTNGHATAITVQINAPQ